MHRQLTALIAICRAKLTLSFRHFPGRRKPLIVSGTNAGSAEVIQAAANVAKALKARGSDVGVTMIARAVNSVGLGMIGGGSLDEALDELESGSARCGYRAGKTICTAMLPPAA
ncbi:NADH-quinone oxidoreductase subunit G [Kluyvera cryocrescens]|uniref:NADH-quinone oxidoreductase subunit G n=1 Tax=Kluyvera cryocrescens TaxID=580 RepID=A0A485B8H1_KLUCR|nr:NADH-quinone oxidoreductase subunit G [Kluyvera cryocrescens]